jgi:hypothetical protein
MSVDAPAAAEVAVIDMERIWSAQAWPYLELFHAGRSTAEVHGIHAKADGSWASPTR